MPRSPAADCTPHYDCPMDVPGALRVIATDVAIVVGVSVAIGASAPRWPQRWLVRDVGPLRLTRWDSADRYQRLGVPRLARVLPEAGAAFGGVSKRSAPRRTPDQIEAYLVEARRGEWVHWLSNLSLVPMAAVGPVRIWAPFAVAVPGINGVFIAILRNNRVRMLARRAELRAQASAHA